MIPQRIVAIGTSAFFGLFDDQHLGGYIGRLKMWHEGNNIDNEVYNLGVSRVGAGETTEEMFKRIVPEASARQPDMILLTTGINDIRRIGSRENFCVTSTEQFKNNIHKMIIAARTVAKEVLFVSSYPIKDKQSSKNDFFLNIDLEEYTNIAKQICEKENASFLDVFSEWEKGEYSDLLGSDGVHANAKGYEKVFKQFKEFLEKKYA